MSTVVWCSSMCCDNTDWDNSKDGHSTKDSVIQPQLSTICTCHNLVIKTSTCSVSVLIGRGKIWVSQMCRAQTTIKQDTDQRNSPGLFTVKDSTHVVPSRGNHANSAAHCRTSSQKASDSMWDPGLLHSKPFKLNPIEHRQEWVYKSCTTVSYLNLG